MARSPPGARASESARHASTRWRSPGSRSPALSAACAFDPAGRFSCSWPTGTTIACCSCCDMASPKRAIRVFGQPDFTSWGYDATPGDSARLCATRCGRFTASTVRFRCAVTVGARILPAARRGVRRQTPVLSDCDNHRVIRLRRERHRQRRTAGIAVLGQADFSGNKPNRGGGAGPEGTLTRARSREGLKNFFGTPGSRR